MISYDEYKNRIEKLAKVKGKLHKFRFLICGALAVVIGGSVGLMVAKGTYMSATEVSATTVNFNEPLKITPAKAFLASARSQKIQYAGEDGVWTESQPVKAGKYQARTVSPKLGGYSYSKPVSFEILPLQAEFTIVGESVTYGDVPDCTVSNLVSGHKLDENSLIFNYENYNSPSTVVSVDESTLKIIDPATGEDYTCCYDITCNSKQLAISNRKITVKPVDQSAVYDGKSVVIENKVTEETAAQLAKGDEIRITTRVQKNMTSVASAVDAGTYELFADGVSVWHGNDDVTARYDMQFLYGQLQIARRAISVSVSGDSKEFDDKPLSCIAFTSENLAEGHGIVLENLPSITDVGTLKNECYIAVMSGNLEVTDNYDISAEFGTLQILPKKVKITTADDQKTYDGTPLYNTSFKHDDTSGAFVYSASGMTKVTDYKVGGEKNIFAIEVTSGGRDVTSNFRFDYEYGTLTINKRPVRITTGGLNEHYNGEEQTNLEAAASDGGMVDGGLLTDLGHRLQVAGTPFTVTDVTGADGEENTTEYAIYEGARNVTENYSITYKYGKLIITARPIVVQIAGNEWVYDGEEHFETGYETYYQYDESQSGLVKAGDELTPKTWTTVKDYVRGETNVVTYEAPNANYVITKVRDGVLNILKREITVTTVSNTWEYDGNEHFDTAYETDIEKTYHLDKNGVKQPALLGEDKLTVSEGYVTVTNVLDSGVNRVIYQVPNANYEITHLAYGNLTVTPREIVVVTFDGTWVYDGEPHSKEGYDTKWAKDENQKGLVGDDELIESNSYSTITNVADPDPKNRVDFNNAPNYKIVREDWGTLKITPRPIKVVTVSKNWTYDGGEHSAEELDKAYTETYFVNENGDRAADIQGNGAGLVKAGEELTLATCVKIKEVGSKANECTFILPNGNYEIKGYDNGTLSVSGRYIKVVTATNDWTYDGEEHADTTYTTYQVDENGVKLSEAEAIVDGTVLQHVASSVTKITNYGTTKNLTRFTVPEVDGKANYIIYGYDDGTLTVNQRHIVVTTVSDRWEYDGKNHYNTAYETDVEKTYYLDEKGVKHPAFVGDDKLTPADDTVQNGYTVVNGYNGDGVDNEVQYSLPLFDGTQSNYTVEYKWGTLTVTRRVVLVATGTTSREYTGEVLKNENYTVEHAVKGTDDKYVSDGEAGEVVNEAGVKDALVLTKDFPGIVNVGEISNNPEFANDNYEIHYSYGKLEVTARNILVTTGSGKWPYDGGEHSNMTYEKVEYAKHVTVVEDGVVKGKWEPVDGIDALVVNALKGVKDTLAITLPCPSIKDAGTIDNECVYTNSNYAVHYVYGKLTVEKKILNITLDKITVIYGEELPETCKYIPVSATDVPVDGETLTVYISYEQVNGANPKNKGTYATKYKSGVIATEGMTEQVSADKNYTVKCEADGTLEIQKRPVTVKIDDQTATYGAALPKNNFTLAEGSLGFADGETLTLDYCYKEVSAPVNKGTYTISYTKKYINGKTEGVDNYDLTVNDGTLTINAFKIAVTIEDATYDYGVKITGNGNQFRINGGEGNRVATGVEIGGVKEYILLDTVHFDGLNGEMPKNVGTYTVTATESDFLFDNASFESCSADNYEITEIKPATLTIVQKEITVELMPFSGAPVVYGNTYSYSAGTGNYANAATLKLAYNEQLEVAVYFKNDKGEILTDSEGNYVKPKNAGTYSLWLDSDNCVFYDEHGTALVDGANNFGAANYKINCEPLTDLEIEKKGISVALLDYEVTYGDYTFDYDDPTDNPYEIKIGNYKGEGFAPALEYGEQIKILGVRFDSADGVDKHIVPRNAGTYKIRPNTKELFFPYEIYEVYDDDCVLLKDGTGNYKFGSIPGTLTIKPKAITVQLSDVKAQYGDAINYPAGTGLNGTGNYKQGENDKGESLAPDLSYGDLLKVNGVKYHEQGENEVEHFNVGDYTVALDGGYTLYDKDGEEIPVGNYAITTVVGKLTVTKRAVTVSVLNKECVYGNALPANGFNITAGGIVIMDEESGTSTQVLPYNETFSVAYHYEQGTNDDITPVNVGLYDIVGVVTAVNGTYGSLGNYDISYKKGVLEITKAPLKVTLSSFKTTYGDPVNYPEGKGENGAGNYVSAVALQNGDLLKVAVDYVGDDGITPWNAGTYKILLNVTNSVIYGKDGKTYGILNNYEVEFVKGTLTIAQRKVTVTSATGVTCHYGNDDLDLPDPTVVAYNDDGTLFKGDGKLPYGEEFTYSVQYEKDKVFYGEPLSVGDYVLLQTVVTAGGSEAGVDNYEITPVPGSLKVEKKVINIQLKKDVSWNYGTYAYGVNAGDEVNGKTPSTCAYDPVSAGDSTAFGEVLEVNIKYYGADGKECDFPKNAGTYAIKAATFTVYSHREENNPYGEAGQETAKWNELTNYIINCEDGLLTVNALSVTVEIPTDVRTTYGYSKFPAVVPAITKDGEAFTLPYGESFEYAFTYYLNGVKVEGLPVNAGTYEIRGEVVKVNATENGVTAEVDGGIGNYSVKVEKGELLIRQKAVTVTVTDKECFYGEALPALNPAIVGTITGETLNVTFKFVKGGTDYTAPQNKGVYAIQENTVTVTGGQGLVENYAITYTLGSLEIKALALTVRVEGNSFIYGGALPEIGYSVTSENKPVTGETLVLGFKFVDKDGAEFNQTDNKPVNAGTYDIIVAVASIAGGNADINNYTITYEENDPKLVINQSTLGEIKLNSEVTDFAYGEDYDKAITNVVVNGVNGQKIVVKVKYSIIPPQSSVRAARRARAFASRAAEAEEEEKLIPKNVGGYMAELDWDSCLVYDGDALIAKGIANYAKPVSVPVLFSISPLVVSITIESNGFTYGGTLPAINNSANVTLPYGESYSLAYKFEKNGKTYNQTDNKPRNAGTYAISAETVSVTAGGTVATYAVAEKEIDGVTVDICEAANYIFAFTKNNPELTIEQREISVALKTDVKCAFGETGAYPAEAGNYRTDDNLAPDLATDDALTVTGVTFVKLDKDDNEVGSPVTAPTDAGVYAIKFVSFKVMHGEEDVTASYSLKGTTDGRLEISASVIRVKSADGEWEYDGAEHTESEYKGGVQILAGSFGENASDYEIVVDELCYVRNVTAGTPNNTTFKVKYKGEFTNNFEVVVEPGTFVVTARGIKISTESNEKYYDGKPLDGKTEENPLGYTITYTGTGENTDALVGNTFKVIKETTVTDASAPVDNTLTFDILDGKGKSVLANYAITRDWGKLQVKPLEVVIDIKDAKTVYGESIEVGFDILSGGKKITLPTGEKFKFETAFFNPVTFQKVTPVEKDGYTLVNVGTYNIGLSGTIEDLMKDDKTVEGGKISNYNITGVTGGTLTVTARIITVRTLDGGMDGEWIYDGYAHSKPEHETALASDGTKDGLICGDTLNASGWATITDVGEKPNSARFTVPNSNYAIAENGVSFGTLKITARKITVLTGTIGENGTIIYDGNEHSTVAADCVEGTSLVKGHKLAVDGKAFGYANATGAAGVDNTTKFKVVDASGNDGVNKNYEITHKYGKIIISKRPVTICSNDITAVYNGAAHSDNSLAVAADSAYPLVSGHRISEGTGVSIYDVTVGTPNTVTYQIIDGKGAPVTSNYDVKFNKGTIIITSATLTINLKQDLKIEYGDLTYASKLFISADGLVGTETFNATFNIDRVVDGKGFYTATLDWNSCTVTNARGNDGLKNYTLANGPVTATFEVIAKKLTLNLATGVSVPYGSDYEALLKAPLTNNLLLNMAYSETLVVKLAYDKENHVNKGVYTAWIDWNNCEVYDKKGNLKAGGLSNYDLTNEGDKVSFKITAVTVTVSMDDIGTVKYGVPYAYTDDKGNYKSAPELVNGEELRVKPVYMLNGKKLDAAPTFAGTYDIAFDGILEVYDKNGKPVTNGASNYNVVCNAENYGKLIITGVNVTVTRKPALSKTYDGTPYEVTAADATISFTTAEGELTALPAGYELRLRAQFKTPSADAKTYANTAEYVVWDVAADSESGEYIANTVGESTITINKKVAKLTTESSVNEHVYDGTALTAGYTLTIDGPIAGHTYEVVKQASVTNVTENPVDNEVTFRFLDGNGNDVTKNYDVQLVGEYGKLQVKKREVTVTLADNVTAVYGETFEIGYTLTSGGVAFAFPAGEEFTFSVTYTVGGIEAQKLTVGEYAINYVDGTAQINGAVSGNYDIRFPNHGTVEITARPIVVTTVSDEWVYDGNNHFNTAYETDVEKTYYLDGDGNKKTAFVNGDGLTAKTTGYTIVKDYNGDDGDVNIVEYEDDANYTVTLAYGKLKITKRTVTVVTGSATKEHYDGQALSNAVPAECYYTVKGANDGLVGDDSLVLVGDAVSVTDATSGNGKQNKNTYKIVGEDGGDSENYVIKYNYGWLKIGKADLTITLTAKQSYQYGDKSFKTDVLTFGEGDIVGLVNGEEPTVVVRFYLNDKFVSDPKDVGEGYEARFNTTSSNVDNGRTGNGLSNYNVTCESIYFDITKKDVTLTLADWDDVTYDGAVHDTQAGKLTVPDGSFEYGETLNAVYSFTADGAEATPVNAGTYTVKLSLTASTMSDGNPLETNYNISWTDGKDETEFTIGKKALTVTLNAVTVDYNGNGRNFVNIAGAYKITGLCASDAANLTLEYFDGATRLTNLPVNANDTAYTVKFVSLDFTSGSADNYSFDGSAVADGSLKIDRRAITLGVASRTAEADDTDYGTDDIIHAYKGVEGEGFVGTDLEDAFSSGELKFAERVLLPAQAGDEDKGVVARYSVSLTVTAGEVLSNYTVATPTAGELTVVKTMINVTVKAKNTVYNGQPVSADNFSFTHKRVKNPSQDAFTKEELEGITATYRIESIGSGVTVIYTVVVDGNGNVTGTAPVDAGDYTVTLTLSGAPLNGYFINNAETGLKTTLTINQRPVTLKITAKEGFPTLAVYGDFDIDEIKNNVNQPIDVSEGDDCGFIDGFTPTYAIGLARSSDGLFITDNKYDAGNYFVAASFSGIKNYALTMNSPQFEITKRLLIVAPDAKNGVYFDYAGKDLQLGENDYKLLKDTTLAEGDALAIISTTVPVTQTAGNVTISEVLINGGAGNDNYKLYFAPSADPELAGLNSTHFRVRLYFNTITINYEQVLAGKQFDYDGTEHVVTIDESIPVIGGVIQLVGDTGLYDEDHNIVLTKNTFGFTEAGKYANWFDSKLQVVDESRRKVACYVLNNVTEYVDDTKKVVVTKNEINVSISVKKSDLIKADGTYGSALTDSFDGTTKKLASGVTVTGLLPDHNCEVILFKIEEELVLGVTVFADNNGKRKDVIANYDCKDIVLTVDYGGDTVRNVSARYIKVSEISTLSNPVLRVTLPAGLTADNLLDNCTLTDGVYYLDGATHSDLTDTEKHGVKVVVYNDGGNLTVGVVVTEKLASGSLRDGSGLYNVILPEVEGVPVGVLKYTDFKNLVRMLVVDLTASFNADGTPIVSGDGRLQNVEVTGLITGSATHIVEIIYSDGGYKVIVYQQNVRSDGKIIRTDKQSVYDFLFRLPAGVSLSESDFERVDVAEVYPK